MLAKPTHAHGQSKPTFLVYLVLPDIFLGSGTLKKGSKIWVAKSMVQKTQGNCYSKREEAAWPLLFLNNNDPVILHPAFCNQYYGPFFKVPDPKKISGRPDTLE